MKVLILMPETYSLLQTIKKGFEANGLQTVCVDYQSFFSKKFNAFVNRFESLPNRLKNQWKQPYIRKANERYIQLYEQEQPDFVFIYNNQLVLPETLRLMKKKSRILFFLGDNPLYTPTFEYNLPILFEADHIFCPDSFWIQQLEQIGVPNLHFCVFGFDEEVFYPFVPNDDDRKRLGCELAYVGTAQKNNWGYKRFLFLDHFRNFDLKAYISGDAYERRWKAHFPELDSHIIPHNRFDPAFNNLLCNCAKLYPVDLVPSLFNGIHIRIMDCIGSGILPLLEYSADLDKVFAGVEIPVIRKYDEAKSLASELLANDERRERMARALRQFALENHAPGRILCQAITRLA